MLQVSGIGMAKVSPGAFERTTFALPRSQRIVPIADGRFVTPVAMTTKSRIAAGWKTAWFTWGPQT